MSKLTVIRVCLHFCRTRKEQLPHSKPAFYTLSIQAPTALCPTGANYCCLCVEIEVDAATSATDARCPSIGGF